MKNKDKVEIKLTLERNVNGSITRGASIEGEGFHFYEIVGLLQIYSYELAQQAGETAKVLHPDKPSRLIFSDKEKKI